MADLKYVAWLRAHWMSLMPSEPRSALLSPAPNRRDSELILTSLFRDGHLARRGSTFDGGFVAHPIQLIKALLPILLRVFL